MTITISSVPSQYRSYLQRADANQNGEIDSASEACSAAQSYCIDNPSRCENIRQFISNTGQYTCSTTNTENNTSNPENGASNPESNRSFRLSFTPGFNWGLGAFFSNSLPDDIRNVPPHPIYNPTARTNPLSFGTLTQPDFSPTLDIKLDFWQYVFLRYQAQFQLSSSLVGPSDVGEIPYPSNHRQPYASGENAFTFFEILNSPSIFKAHFLTIGTYLYRGFDRAQSRNDHWEYYNVSLEAGLAETDIRIVTGWDNFGRNEIRNVQTLQYFGARIALSLNIPQAHYVSNHFAFGLRADVGANLYPSGLAQFFFNISLPFEFRL